MIQSGNLFRIGGIALLCLLSCNREELPSVVQEETSSVTVSLPQTGKTSLGQRSGNVWPTLWNEGDCISLGGNVSYPLSKGDSGRSTASFVFAGSVKAPYNIVYPATQSSSSVIFPAVQNFVEGSFDPAAAPMYSASKSFDNADMLHLGSLLKLSLKSETGISLSQIQVSSMGGETLSGEFTMATDEVGLFTGEFLSAEGSTSVSMDFGEGGYEVGTQPMDFFIGIPHGTYSRGLSILVITSDSRVMNLTFCAKTGVEIAAGKIIEFETVEFEGAEKILLVKDIDDLKSLSSQPEGTTAFLISDIDLSAEDWTPLEEISINVNGAGHNLTGLKQPLCKLLSGQIKDLNINASIDETLSATTAAFALDLQGDDALIENCCVSGSIRLSPASASGRISLGGIAASQNDGTIRGCTSAATLTIGSSLVSEEMVDIGGIVGNEVATIENCTNNGALIVESGAQIGSYLNAGGVCGCIEGSASHLYGNGPVSVQGGVVIAAEKARQHVGGVVGYHIGDGSILSNLVGNAAVSTGSSCTAASSANAIGGVIGKNNAGIIDGTVTNTSDASVRVTLADNAMNTGVGGIVGYSYNAVKGLSVKDVVNNASVEVIFPAGYNQDVISIGGITGYLYSNENGNPMSISNCINKGSITTRGAASPATTDIVSGIRLGGLFGHVQITGASAQNVLTIDGCRNEGPVAMLESAGGKFCFEGGITATAWAVDVRMLECTNTASITREGFTSLFYMGGIMAHHYRSGPGSILIEGCSNSGKIGFYDGAAANTAEVSAGGIIGMISAKGSNTLDFTIRGCSNSGNIDRRTEVASYAGRNSFGGGIIGGMGKSHSISGYDVFENALIEDCTNSGQVIFNQFKGFETFIEKTTNNSFCGGIVGCTRSSKNKVIVKNCSNSGNILSTSGFDGGIVGMMAQHTVICGEKTAEGIRYCTNTGCVGKVSEDDSPATLGSGYLISGGIAGYLKNKAEELRSSITYCWNAGEIYGTTQNSSPCAGGIVGKLLEGGVVTYCKNSGDVRNYKSDGKGGLLYSGAISGNTPLSGATDYQVAWCGVGGKVYRTSGWTKLEEGGTYPWQNYIYSDTAMLDEEGNPLVQYPADKYYKGCTFWDGVSKLSWEE